MATDDVANQHWLFLFDNYLEILFLAGGGSWSAGWGPPCNESGEVSVGVAHAACAGNSTRLPRHPGLRHPTASPRVAGSLPLFHRPLADGQSGASKMGAQQVVSL